MELTLIVFGLIVSDTVFDHSGAHCLPQAPSDLCLSCLSFPNDSSVSSCLALSLISERFILLTSKPE